MFGDGGDGGFGGMDGDITGSNNSPLLTDGVKAILVLVGFLVAFFLLLVLLG
ncbi:hypothetical protein M0R89_13370 [Halorussus limi]|uniref:Uncharacterized protein n=1 Tax=Halorussus limi TaxID=2938695 RepID=A0A8U0HRK7_9EURY|nr:hypothetical protein [Halorussus limi]UPV73527.1 hypothetical protein M0R89_13370 [Halorussus limi]